MESMNHINSNDRGITPPRDFKFESSKKPSGLTVARVRDFTLFMKLIAQYDLWDEMETELKSQGCTKFFISLKPMRAIGSALKKKVSIGDLPADSPAISACNGCNGDGGDAGAAEEAAKAAESAAKSGVMKPGTSRDVGSKDKAQ
jgi:hypothetical protein